MGSFRGVSNTSTGASCPSFAFNMNFQLTPRFSPFFLNNMFVLGTPSKKIIWKFFPPGEGVWGIFLIPKTFLIVKIALETP